MSGAGLLLALPMARPPVRITYRTEKGVRAPLYELYYCTACADIGLKERKAAAHAVQ